MGTVYTKGGKIALSVGSKHHVLQMHQLNALTCESMTHGSLVERTDEYTLSEVEKNIRTQGQLQILCVVDAGGELRHRGGRDGRQAKSFREGCRRCR